MDYPEIKLGNKIINKVSLPYVIAEIGNNHEGDVELAKEMIYLASEAGCDAVKFQTIRPELLVSPENKNRISQLKKFELSCSDFINLKKGIPILVPYIPEILDSNSIFKIGISDYSNIIFGKKIIGSIGGDISIEKNLKIFNDIIEKNKIFKKIYFKKEYSLNQINKAILDFKNGKIIRPLIKF